MPRIFTEEFKKDAVALVESGMPQKQVAADPGVSKTELQTWGSAMPATNPTE